MEPKPIEITLDADLQPLHAAGKVELAVSIQCLRHLEKILGIGVASPGAAATPKVIATTAAKV